MKKCFLLIMVIFTAAAVWAQSDDDVYFVPKKQYAKAASAETYYVGSDRDVDEYNRHSGLQSSVSSLDDDDTFDFDGGEGVYPDSIAGDTTLDETLFYDVPDDDFAYSRELDRWYGDDKPCVDDPDEWLSCRRLYAYPYYGWWGGWYSPLYYSGLWGWYDPWYCGYWWDWYGWCYPSCWGGWHGGIHHGWLAGGGHGHGYSNRGHVNVASTGARSGVSGQRNSRNVYNNIANRGNSRGVSSMRGVSSVRTTGVNSSTRNNTTTRTYTPSHTTTHSSAGGHSGGSHGSFGGGGFGGGGFHGGGGHGGRR